MNMEKLNVAINPSIAITMDVIPIHSHLFSKPDIVTKQISHEVELTNIRMYSILSRYLILFALPHNDLYNLRGQPPNPKT